MIGDLVVLNVYDRDNVTVRDTVSATGVQWSDELGAEGSAQMTVPLVQAILSTKPNLLVDGSINVAVRLTDTGAPAELYGYLTDPGDITLIGANEEADRQQGMTCRGLMALFDDWVVFPESGAFDRDSPDDRVFNYANQPTPDWYVSAQWTAPQAVQWNDSTSTRNKIRPNTPRDWPDPTAWWLWPTNPNTAVPPGTNAWFRKDFTLSADRDVMVYATADDAYDLYLDGELIISSDRADPFAWHTTSTYSNRLKAGSHWFAAKATNTWKTGSDNIAGLIVALYSLTSSGDRSTLILHSDTSWVTYTGPGVPGWTAAAILTKLINEASARGIASASRMVLDFTATTDSASNTFTDVEEMSIRVGTSGTDVVKQLAELAVDIDVRPGLHVKAYQNQGTDKSATVKFVKGTNLLSYTAHGDQAKATRLIVRTDEGYVEATDSAAETGHDPREAVIEAGQSLSLDQGTALANKSLVAYSTSHWTYTAVIIGTTGCVPTVDFGKGDEVMAYDHTMTAAPMRVVSIGGAAPDAGGVVQWTVELEEP